MSEVHKASMTPPDKTLEELVAAVVNAAFDCGEYDGDDSNYEPVLGKSQAAKKALFDYFQSATASQQREVDFRDSQIEMLQTQLRTERERTGIAERALESIYAQRHSRYESTVMVMASKAHDALTSLRLPTPPSGQSNSTEEKR